MAADQLLPLVYDELRRLAAHKMANEAAGKTLQPTALVHEVWLRLAGKQPLVVLQPRLALPGNRTAKERLEIDQSLGPLGRLSPRGFFRARMVP